MTIISDEWNFPSQAHLEKLRMNSFASYGEKELMEVPRKENTNSYKVNFDIKSRLSIVAGGAFSYVK